MIQRLPHLRTLFQYYEMNDAFTFANRLQQYRPCKSFGATFIRAGEFDNVH